MTSRGLLPYGRQWIDESDIRAVVSVLKSDFLTQGPEIEKFEGRLRALTGAKHCVAVANGTAALHLAVAALDIKRGGEGVTSANTFVASANAMVYNGLIPVLADIEHDTGNISVPGLEKRLSRKTKLLLPVHFAGQPADMARIRAVARTRGLFVIEDAAHAIGSRYRDGSAVGNCRFSDLTTFSFHPVKTITSGEGGAVTTNDKKLYERLKLLRTHGITKEGLLRGAAPDPWYYEMRALGFNYRMTDLQAALGSSQLKRLGAFVRRRRGIVKRYNAAFRGRPFLSLPVEREGVYSAFHLYVVRVDFKKLGKDRASLMAELARGGVGTQVHYIPVSRQPFYRKEFFFDPGDTPAAEEYYEQALSLPLYPKMSDEDVERVIRQVLRASR